MVGLAYALRPIGTFKRLVCLALAFFGVAVIYYSQVRMILLMLVICLAVLVAVFVMQRSFGYATLPRRARGGDDRGRAELGRGQLGPGRRRTLPRAGHRQSLGDLRQVDRGGLIMEALTRTMWESPMGAGLGWWGTIYGALGRQVAAPVPSGSR